MKSKPQIFATASLIKMSRLGVETLLLPSLPAISIALDEPRSRVQLTVTLYILGLLLSKLIVSVVGDNISPKKLLLTLLPFMTVGSIISFYPNLVCILIGRLLQGLSLGCATSIGLLILKSQYQQNEMKSKISLFGAVTLWGPLIAILMGGFIQHFFDWQMNVLFIMSFSILLIGATFYYLPSDSHRVKKKKTSVRYHTILKSSYFLCIAYTYSSFLAARIVIFTMTPFIFIHFLKLPAYAYSLMLVPYYLGAFLSNFCIKTFPEVLSRELGIVCALILAYVSMALLCLDSVIEHHWFIPFILSFFLFGCAEAISTTNCLASYPTLFPKCTGTAACLSGIFASLFAMICLLLTTHLLSGSVLSLALGVFVIVSLSVIPTIYLIISV